MKDIYEAKYVEDLFDRMSGSYDKMNYVTSFGFSNVWRNQCVKAIGNKDSKNVVDLMSGMGECWSPIFNHFSKLENLVSLDFSHEMVNLSKKKLRKYSNKNIQLLKENVFSNSIKDEFADTVISGFGLKTFNSSQLDQLAKEIHRILKVNGEFSLIDVSVPKSKVLRPFFMFYLKSIIPIIGKIFLGNPETYKMLGVYTQLFKNSKGVKTIFSSNGFQVQYISYFFGCATGIQGKKLVTQK